MKKNRALVILKNTASNYLRQVVQIVVFLFLTPFIVQRLGAKPFGLWSLIQATVGLFGLMDMGFSTSVVKYVADARGRNDLERLRELTATFFWLYTALGLATVSVALALTPFLDVVLKIPPEYLDDARLVFVLISLRSALAMPLGMFNGVLTGFQRQSWSSLVKSAGTLLYGALAVWALTTRPSLGTLAWASLASHVAVNVGAAALCLTRLEGVSLSPWRVRLGRLREVMSFSTYFFLIQISLLIYARVDLIVIQLFASLSAVALYAVASRVSTLAATFCRQLTNALTPMIAELKGAGEEANIRAVFIKGSKLAAAGATPLLAGLWWYAPDVLGVWMGEEFRAAAPACRILVAAMFIGVVHANAPNVLSMTGHQRFVAFSVIGGQMLNLGLTLALVVPMGIEGVAWATLISSAFVEIVVVQRRANRLNGLTMGGYYGRALAPSVPALGLMLGGLWAIEHWIAPVSLFRIAALEATGIALFGLGFVVLGLSGKERAYYGDRILRALRRRPAMEEAKS